MIMNTDSIRDGYFYEPVFKKGSAPEGVLDDLPKRNPNNMRF
jgi:hypothetical protein